VTEVPEHLLKRSRDRRAALGLGGGDGGGAGGDAAASTSEPGREVQAAASTAAARPAAITPAEATIEPAKPRPAYVQASLNRKKIPLWVMPVLAVLPLWAIVYVNTLSKPRTTIPSQLDAGTAAYATKCSSCHQADGSGGNGRPLYAAADGGVVATFPNIVGQLEFVWLGSQLTASPVGSKGTPYGSADRKPSQHTTLSYNGNPMPTFKGTLTQTELLEIVRHERETFGGEKVPAKQIAADGSLLWPNGKPMLDATGTLVGPDGKALFDADGKLNDPTLAAAAGGTEQAAGS
jgi:cytochrome c553